MAEQPLDGRAVEQVGGVLDQHAPSRRPRSASDSERSNLAVPPSTARRLAAVSPGQLQRAGGAVLEAKHHLEERRAREVALGPSSSTSFSNGRSWWA